MPKARWKNLKGPQNPDPSSHPCAQVSSSLPVPIPTCPGGKLRPGEAQVSRVVGPPALSRPLSGLFWAGASPAGLSQHVLEVPATCLKMDAGGAGPEPPPGARGRGCSRRVRGEEGVSEEAADRKQPPGALAHSRSGTKVPEWPARMWAEGPGPCGVEWPPPPCREAGGWKAGACPPMGNGAEERGGERLRLLGEAARLAASSSVSRGSPAGNLGPPRDPFQLGKLGPPRGHRPSLELQGRSRGWNLWGPTPRPPAGGLRRGLG